MRQLLCSFVLVLCTGVAHAAATCSTPSVRPVGQQEAQTFGERVTQQLQRHDKRATQAYRADSEFLLLLTQAEQPVGIHLKGRELAQFLTRNLGAKVPTKTGTSCRYDVRQDGKVLESCISVNVLQPRRASFSISLIARQGKSLYYQTTLVTDSAQLASRFGVFGDDEADEEDDDGEVPQA